MILFVALCVVFVFIPGVVAMVCLIRFGCRGGWDALGVVLIVYVSAIVLMWAALLRVVLREGVGVL